MKLNFTKMEGIGNDYVYFDGINQNIPMDKAFIQKISNRHTGIGSDGMIVILPSSQYDFKMRMFNSDGSEAMMCGNGVRCFAKFCYDNQLTNKKVVEVETKAGLRVVTLNFDGDQVVGARVNMQPPILDPKMIPVLYEGNEMINVNTLIGDQVYALTALSMGNPHVVTFVESLDFDIHEIGPLFEKNPLFPQSVNTEFVQIIDKNNVKMRVYERGSGETLACGTGACAVVVASYLNGLTSNVVNVELLGGVLKIEYIDGTVYMEGPATNVFNGSIEL